jgi:aldehyde:ferredoxin oxidoreductase
MPNGYHGRFLRIDLSTGTVSIETPDDLLYRQYMGGWGFLAHYLLRELPPGIDPLGPANKLIFALGVVTGAPVAGGARHAVGAKSPLTGGFGAAEAGGFWGAELKKAGWDGIIVEGRAPGPVYLWVEDETVEIREAANLWNLETRECEARIRVELGDKRIRVSQIGPGGENMVRFACIMNDLKDAAGRTGLGAVMGSKNLKAIAVRGHGTISLADAQGVSEIAKLLRDACTGTLAGWHDYGTGWGLTAFNAAGGLPTRYFQEGSFEGAEKIAPTTFMKTIGVEMEGCYACAVRCKKVVRVTGARQVDPEYGGPEYETLAALGSLCGIDDVKAISYANQRCNANTIDTISTGNAIAFAMKCYERGILTAADADGIELAFGNADAMVAMVDKIAKREGIGDLLAEGVCRAAKKIGEEAEDLAIHVKGQEVPMHEPRIKFALDIGYATSPTGADHVHVLHDTDFVSEGHTLESFKSLGIMEPLAVEDLGPAKVRLAAYQTIVICAYNCIGLCMLAAKGLSLTQLVRLVSSITGWDTSLFELMKAGERALNMARAFNTREGFTAADDTPPPRFSVPFSSGPRMGVKVPRQELDKAICLYYQMMGWDTATAAPTLAKLLELDLGWVADELARSKLVPK